MSAPNIGDHRRREGRLTRVATSCNVKAPATRVPRSAVIAVDQVPFASSSIPMRKVYPEQPEGGSNPWVKLLILLGIGGIGALVMSAFGSKKRIFISFDFDHDRHYRYLLDALKENSRSEIDYEDVTPDEIQSTSVATIKAGLLAKLQRSTHALVIVGSYANSYDPRSAEIGQRNWQWWEIVKAKEQGKGLIAVKIEKANDPPEPLMSAKATWAL